MDNFSDNACIATGLRYAWIHTAAMKTYTIEDFRRWGAQGGRKSKRTLTAAQAKAMVAARELKRQKTKRVTRRANDRDQRRREPRMTMDDTTTPEQPETRRSLHAVVSRHCAHIRKPYTLEEICEQVSGNEYNAELMLQHLMLWVSANDLRERPATQDSRQPKTL